MEKMSFFENLVGIFLVGLLLFIVFSVFWTFVMWFITPIEGVFKPDLAFTEWCKKNGGLSRLSTVYVQREYCMLPNGKTIGNVW